MQKKSVIIILSLAILILFTACSSNKSVAGKAFEVPTTTIKALSAPSSSTYNLEIFSDPNGADVFIDGNKVGTTPLSLDSQTKEIIKIKISKAGYEDYSVNLKAPPGDTYYVGPKLKAK